MELFYTRDISGNICRLEADESAHCVRVMRHRAGDEINVIDGEGTFYRCRLVNDSPKGAEAEIVEILPDWGPHPYRLTMAVCPTKNMDRYEWFAEKATELGMDELVPVIGEHSERRIIKTERLQKILLSATKQSLKGAVPNICEPVSVSDFIRSRRDSKALKLIAYCFEGDTRRVSIKEALCRLTGGVAAAATSSAPCCSLADACSPAPGLSMRSLPEIVILIGPEGDFSRYEAALALDCGFLPVHLGASRLRTETAAAFAVAAVYYHLIDESDK